MSENRSAWAMGYATFAGVILMVGVFQAIAGLVGIIDQRAVTGDA